VLLEDQDALSGTGRDRRKGLPHRPGNVSEASRPYQVQARWRRCMPGRTAEDTDWAGIDLLSATLERMQPSPVITLNALWQSPSSTARRQPSHDRAAGSEASGYFYFHGLRGARSMMQLGRARGGAVGFHPGLALPTRSRKQLISGCIWTGSKHSVNGKFSYRVCRIAPVWFSWGASP